jgi:hypothetical protein
MSDEILALLTFSRISSSLIFNGVPCELAKREAAALIVASMAMSRGWPFGIAL